MMYNFLLFLFTSFSLIFSPIVRAQDAVPIEKGEPAPYSGTLLTNEAAASLLTQIQTCKDQAQVDLEYQLSRLQAECTLKESMLNLQLDSQQLRYDNIVGAQSQQLDFLLEAKAPPRMSKEVVFIIGVVSGVALTAVSAYSLSAASSAN